MSDISVRWRNARSEVGTIISQVDMKLEKLEAEEKRMENKRDESYIRGAEDMVEAIRLFSNNEESGGMSLDTMKELFGYGNFLVIIENVPPEVVIKKVKQWKEEREREKPKETEVKVGDEVEFLNTDIEKYKKYIVIVTDPDSSTFWLFNPVTFSRLWIDKDDSNYKKTGRHFDTINIPEGGAII